MRDIKYLVVHCTATPQGKDYSLAIIRDWHVKGNGWSDIGYHFVIHLDGKVSNGRPVEKIGAHVTGYNSNSIGISLVGGGSGAKRNSNPKDIYTPAQLASLKSLLITWKHKYPNAEFIGHRDFPKVAKDCPCFDVKAWLKSEGVM